MHVAFALPSPVRTGGGHGLAYAEAMAAGLHALGHTADILQGDDPRWPPGALPVIDGLLLPRLLHRLDELAASGAVALVHHALAAAGRDDASRAAVTAQMQAMLPKMRRVVATSQPVADQLRESFGRQDVRVVRPGMADRPRSMASGPSCTILSIGVLTPRKGHDRLLRAMARLGDLDWSLTIAGASGRDPGFEAALADLIPDLGLAHRVRLERNPSPAVLEEAWQQAALFASATLWEGYAAGVAEALRRGVPVVVTESGGASVPAVAGAVCPADDAPTFSKVLRRMVFDRSLRAAMAEAAWLAGQALPSWDKQVGLFADALFDEGD